MSKRDTLKLPKIGSRDKYAMALTPQNQDSYPLQDDNVEFLSSMKFFSKRESHLPSIYAKLCEPTQYVNRIKAEYEQNSPHSNRSSMFNDSNLSSYTEVFGRRRPSQANLVSLELSSNSTSQFCNNAFNPNRNFKTERNIPRIKYSKDSRSDWSRRSLFEAPTIQHLLNVQKNLPNKCIEF